MLKKIIEAIKKSLEKGISPEPVDASLFVDNINELSSFIYEAKCMRINVTVINTDSLSQAQRDELRWAGKGYVTLKH